MAIAQSKGKFPKIIETIDKKSDEIIIPYKKYELENGLTIIIHEDHSDPIVHIDVTYHVGSAREVPGRSGFAHFFEHMMFQGSENVADEEHFKIIQGAGGEMNGTTNKDRTNYFETLPSNYLEIALWLEADRMGFLLDAVTQEKFEVQRATVKNEREQNYDNRPYGLVWEKISQAMYPEGHAYSWPTIGYIDELNEATLIDLKNFFLMWYGPNNATLTVAGDVSTDEVLLLAQKYFGPINRGIEIPKIQKLNFLLDEDRYISYEDNIRFPMIQLVFPTIPARHEDEAPLDVLSHILGGNKNSIFYKNFDKTQKALQSTVYHPCSELHGNMHFVVIPFPGKSLSEMEILIRNSIYELSEIGINEEEVNRYKASKEAEFIFQLESVKGKASILASYQTYTQNPNYINEDIKRYQNVTAKDVERVFKEYILNKHAVILSVVPKNQQSLVAKPNNFTNRNVVKTGIDFSEENITYKKPKDNFDRSIKPKNGESPSIKIPEYWTKKLNNNLKIIGTYSDEIPAVGIQISIPIGHRNETLQNSGIASLLAELMNESTLNYSVEEITQQLETLGSELYVSSSKENITIFLKSLYKHIDSSISLLKEVMFNPGFYKDDFNRLKKSQIESIENQKTNASTIANNIFTKLIYGEKHIYATPTIGTLESIKKITLEDVKNYYQNNFSPKNAKVVIVGNLEESTTLSKLNFLNDWNGKKVLYPEQQQSPVISKTKIYLCNKKDAPQSEIRIGYLTNLPYDVTGEYYKSVIMNYQLGGNFNSRINSNLREEKGLTYGAFSYFNSTKEPGPFIARASVKGESTDLAISEFMREISNYNHYGINEEELKYTKTSIGQNEALKYETLNQKTRFLKRILSYNLSSNYLDIQNKILNKISKKEINELASKFLNYNQMVIVVVGDSANIYPQLQKLSYDIIMVNEKGEEFLSSDNIIEMNSKVNQKETFVINKTKEEKILSEPTAITNANSVEEAFRIAANKLGYSKNKIFIFNGNKYTTEHKNIKPIKELDLSTFDINDFFIVEELFFQENSSTLNENQKNILNIIANKIRASLKNYYVKGICSNGENNALSSDRAKTVLDILHSNGATNIFLSNETEKKISIFKDNIALKLNRNIVFTIKE